MSDYEDCGECGGHGYLSDGGCDGGCDFCRPFPRCEGCKGTGRVAVPEAIDDDATTPYPTIVVNGVAFRNGGAR